MTQLRIHDDFTRHIIVTPDDYQWVPSPMPGVERMMLDRIGDEVARATTIVRYRANSEFSPHMHGGGEEFFVLEGVFSDEFGDYPVGTYVRNPIGTSHRPKVGPEGATIFVKLHQFAADDKIQKVIHTTSNTWREGSVSGLRVQPLHEHKGERTLLIDASPNTQVDEHQHHGGEEIYVLNGTLYDEWGTYPKGTWIRYPRMSKHAPYTKEDGTTILVKTGHLPA